MNGKLTVIGLISGVVCALAVFAFTQQVQSQADAERAAALERFGGEQVEVCVATRDIAAGEAISMSNATTKTWIADLLPAHSLSLAQAMGRRVTSPIVEGEVLTEPRFAEGEGLLEIPKGLVAVSLPAEDVNAVGGAVEPGMKVDVYLAGSESATPLARSVLVLATSAGTSAGTGKKIAWVTVAVDENRVQEFVSAANQGNLYFTIPGEGRGA